MPALVTTCRHLQRRFVFSRLLFFWLFPGIEEHTALGKVSFQTALVFFQKQLSKPAAERQNEVTLPVGLTSVTFTLRSLVKTQDCLLDQQRGMCSPWVRPAGYTEVTREMLFWAHSAPLAARAWEKLREAPLPADHLLAIFSIDSAEQCFVQIRDNARMLFNSQCYWVPGAWPREMSALELHDPPKTGLYRKLPVGGSLHLMFTF